VGRLILINWKDQFSEEFGCFFTKEPNRWALTPSKNLLQRYDFLKHGASKALIKTSSITLKPLIILIKKLKKYF